MPKGKRQNASMVQTPDKEQSSAWDFDVYQEELKTSRGNNSGIHAVVRADTHAVVGQYRGVKALSYPKLVQTFEDALAKNGFAFSRTLLTTGNGARFFGKYKLQTIKIGNEEYQNGLTLQSSHDGSLTPGFSYLADRLACLNAMMIMATVFSMFKKHSETLDLSFIGDNIQKAIEAGQNHIAESVDKMAAIKVDDKKARNVISNIIGMGKKVGVSERTGYLIYNNWRNPTADETPLGDTLYRLYNSATRLTRDVEKVGRFELSRKSNLYVTGAFDLAARRSSDLQTLFASPQTPLDFDGVAVNLN
jgi:hypothetical protein